MPVFEYSCTACQHRFEALVRGQERARCEKCGSEELERLLSLPAVKSEGTHNLALRAAKKRDAALGRDRMHEQLRYEKTHDRHG
jgi:putative FmdB family regulatory protein